MSDIISALLTEREEKVRAAKATQAQKEQEAIEKLLTEMKVFLGDFWSLLEERGQKTGEKYNYYPSRDGRRLSVRYEIPALPEYSLAPITVYWDEYSLNSGFRSYSERFRVWGSYFSDLAEALAEARESYPKYLEDKRKKRVEEFKNATPLYYAEGEGLEEKYLSLIDGLISEYPDLKETLENRFENWKKSRAEHFERQEELRRTAEQEKAERAIRETLKLSYIQALAEYLKIRDAIEDSNRETAKGIQEKADSVTYTVYKLSYSVLSLYYEDGEQFNEVETRSVYTFDEEPSGGYWRVNGKDIKYLQAFSLERMAVKPSDEILSKKVTKAGIDFFFHPEASEEAIADILASIQELPQAPKGPEELNSRYDSWRWIEAARHLIETGEIKDPGNFHRDYSF